MNNLSTRLILLPEKGLKRFFFFKWFAGLCIAVIISSGVSAQNRSQYTLLWKISGKGMTKPSFLFGTMHVEDKRVFHFSDSVMLAIQSCPRFALEVQPDSAINDLFNLMSNSNEEDLKKMLTNDEYRKLEKKFKEKNGYSIGKTNPLMLESLMEHNDKNAGDRQSFVDAYLYGIARTLNKKIYGLEDAASQIDKYFGSPDAVRRRLLGIMDDDEQLYAKRDKDEMVRIYSSGDISKVYNFIKGADDVDSTLIARNKVMAASIIQNMAAEPIFSAVGAAHLPGPSGVIALLQKEGYNVTPVTATFTGVADTFRIDYLKVNWSDFSDSGKGYTVGFPGKPLSIKMLGVPYQVYADLADGLYFGCYVVHKGTPSQPMTPKEAFASTEYFYATHQNNTIVNERQFLYKDYPCAEVLLKNNTRYVRLRLVFANNLMYHFYVGSVSGQFSQAIIDRYFNSVSIAVLKPRPPAPWDNYTDKTAAFSVKFPFAPVVAHKQTPSGSGEDSVNYVINTFISTDTVNSHSYVVQYYDHPAGTYLADKKAALWGYVKDFEKKGTLVGKPKEILNNGVQGVEAKFVLDGGFETTIKTFVKGNRIYLLIDEILQSGLKHPGQSDPFVDSFQFLPCAEAQGYTWQPENTNYRIQLPARPLLKPEHNNYYSTYLSGTIQCLANNSNSGALYDFECLKISPYYSPGNVDSIFEKKVKSYVSYGDTLLKLDTIKLNGITGREVLTMDTASKVKRRIRVFIDGENYFFLTARTDESELHNKTTDTFFNSLTITSPSAPVDLASRKAEKITHDLQSADTLVRKKALGAIKYYNFRPNELHYLYDVLNVNFPDDTDYDGVRISILEKLKSLGNDTTQRFLTKLYSGLTGKDEIKAAILSCLPTMNHNTGYDVYFNLLKTDPPLKATRNYSIFYPLIDSVEYAEQHFADLVPFIKHDAYRPYVLRIAANILESKKTMNSRQVINSYSALTVNIQSDLENYLKLKDSDDNDSAGNIGAYLRLMKCIKNVSVSDRFTSRYLQQDPKGVYVSDAIIARIYNGLPNRPALMKRLMDSIDVRYDLMKACYENKQIAMIPEVYRKQAGFAKLCLYKYVSEGDEADDEGSPTNMQMLGNLSEKDYTYYAFKFSLGTDEDSKTYVGIAGPYKKGSVELNFDSYHAYSGYDELKTDWRAQAQQLIKPLTNAKSQ